jgi:hypothetical protein
MRRTINADAAFALLLCSSLSYFSVLFVPVGFSVGITDSGYHNQLLIVRKYIFLDAYNIYCNEGKQILG